MQSEADLINKYFKRTNTSADLSIGDDSAVVSTDKRLVVSVDTMVAGTHFKHNHNAYDVGYKALGTALSDLAAMGATARWTLLCLTLPSIDEPWLEKFSNGFFTLAQRHNVELIGGDMTRGALAISVQVMGEVENNYMKRSSAKCNDGIYVTGCLPLPGLLGLHANQINANPTLSQQCLARYHRPDPRLEQGEIIARYADCATDISDGVLLDLSHILTASNVGATIELKKLPVPTDFYQYCLNAQSVLDVLAYGEDYELLFTMNDEYYSQLCDSLNDCSIAITRIGRIDDKEGLRCFYDGEPVELPARIGYDHFAQ